MEGGKPRLSRTAKAIGRRRRSLPTRRTAKSWWTVRQAPGRNQPANTVAAVKRLIGRKFTDDVVKKDKAMVSTRSSRPTTVMPGWSPGQEDGVSRDLGAGAHEDEKTPRTYLGETVTEAVITVPAYSTIRSARPQGCGRIAGLNVKRIINERHGGGAGLRARQDGGDARSRHDLGGRHLRHIVIEIAEVDGERQFEVCRPLAILLGARI